MVLVLAAIQLLTESVLQYAEEKKLRLETLRYAMNEEQLMSDEGEPVDGWVQITVGYEVGSTDPFTEEDRKELEERRKKREEQMIEEDQEVGDAALRAMGVLPPAEDQIQ